MTSDLKRDGLCMEKTVERQAVGSTQAATRVRSTAPTVDVLAQGMIT